MSKQERGKSAKSDVKSEKNISVDTENMKNPRTPTPPPEIRTSDMQSADEVRDTETAVKDDKNVSQEKEMELDDVPSTNTGQSEMAPESHTEGEEETYAEKDGDVFSSSKEERGGQEQETYNEVMAEKVTNNRELAMIIFSNKRKNFARYLQRTTLDTIDTYRYFPNYTDPNYSETNQRMVRDFSTQHGEKSATVAVQTYFSREVNKSTQTTSLTDTIVDNTEQENENDAIFMDSLKRMETRVSDVLQSNNTLQLFTSDFDELGRGDTFVGGKNDNYMKEMQSFSHAEYSKDKKISSLSWQPKARGTIAFACIDAGNLTERLDNVGKSLISHVVIWNFNDPIYPQLILQAPFDVMCLRFNPTQPSIIAGGLINGQVILWDLEMINQQAYQVSDTPEKDGGMKENMPHLTWKYLSTIESSHRYAVTDVQWIPDCKEVIPDGSLKLTKDNQTYQFVSVSNDGRMHIWDIRKDNVKKKMPRRINDKLMQQWLPYHSNLLMQVDQTSELAVSSLQLGSGEDGSPYVVYCTTHMGEVAIGDWSPVRKANDGNENTSGSEPRKVPVKKVTNANTIKMVFGLEDGSHSGPACAVHKHPHCHDIFLSVGDWCFKIWKVGCDNPIWTSTYCSVPLTCARWSPTRPGVAYVGRSDGMMEVWDFTDKSHEASLISQVSQQQITTMEFRSGEASATHSFQSMAVGSINGTLVVLVVPRNLIRPVPGEIEYVQQFFDREKHRTEYFGNRWALHGQRQDQKKYLQERNDIERMQQELRGAEADGDELDYVELKKEFLKMIMEEDA